MNLRVWWKRVLPREKRIGFCVNLTALIVPALYKTWHTTSHNEEVIRRAARQYGGAILVTWHGRVFTAFAAFAERGYHALVSRSEDGDLLAGLLGRLGWGLIRGSSGRRAVAALKQANEVMKKPGAIIALTPDGPRGPSEIAKSGMIYFAQKTGKPVIPGGFSARPRIVFRSWDMFQLPLPFARCRIVYGDPIFIGPDEDLDAATLRVQNAINEHVAQADRELGYDPQPVPAATSSNASGQNW
ncbi:MAG: lysophospholipid acyltransferase family protein [Akkermansiaceae bacterium]|nr:lysophospholipid acyltransferase family protein [Armatimonadota bacterium]